MTGASEAPLASVPAHVPPERVFDFDFFDDPRIRDDIQLGFMSLHAQASSWL